MPIKSGTYWVSQFPTSTSTSDLESNFRGNAEKFIAAVQAGGANVAISTTYRPPQRAYLMHWSWEIATHNFDAQHIPSMTGVDIDWWHDTQEESRLAAQQMVTGFGIDPTLAVAPALNSRHTQGLAIDMSITWTGVLNVKKADDTYVMIADAPHNSTNASLIAVGATYGVIHFLMVNSDRNHWSNDGH